MSFLQDLLIQIIVPPIAKGVKRRTDSKEAKKRYEVRERAIQKIGYKAQITPLVYAAVVLGIYVLGTNFIYDKLHCPDNQNCRLWGSYFSHSAGFLLSGFFLAITAAIVFGKGELPGTKKVARWLLPFVLIFFIVGNYASFKTYLKTTDTGVKSRDFMNEYIGNIKPFELKWEEIKGFGINARKVDGECKINQLFLVVNNNDKVTISTIANDDQQFLSYLERERKLERQPGTGDCQYLH